MFVAGKDLYRETTAENWEQEEELTLGKRQKDVGICDETTDLKLTFVKHNRYAEYLNELRLFLLLLHYDRNTRNYVLNKQFYI